MTKTIITISGYFFGWDGALDYTKDNDFVDQSGNDGTQEMIFNDKKTAIEECNDIMRNGDLEHLKCLKIIETIDVWENEDLISSISETIEKFHL